MSAIVPWKTKKETSLVETDNEEKNPVVQRKLTEVTIRKGGSIIQVRSKEVMIAGKKRKIDPHQLIRMIKRVTQNIGEYKNYEDVYSSVIVTSLRKARGDLVSILENEFSIHWQINEDGESNFYM